MARLIVQAEGTAGTGASSGIAKPGNQLPLYLVVSVTRSSGTAVTGLTSTHFQVQPIVVAPGGAEVSIDGTIEPQAGAYLVQVIPPPTVAWQLGRYIFWIAVHSGANHGQALCAVFVD